MEFVQMKSIFKKILIIILIVILSNLLGMFFKVVNAVVSSDKLVIVLDPGHGPSDSGAIGNGLVEREINFKIAKYLKDELEARDSNITVYLTHSGNFSGSKLELDKRAEIAADLKADIVISLHINGSTNTNANGAEVYITRDTSENRYNKNCKLLGDLILKELADLGIYNLGTKNSPVGNTTTPNNREYYDSGIEVDYYGMIRYPRKLDIPGIIVEHCFISNAGDTQKYISTDEQIKKIAKADANAILEAVSKGYIVKLETWAESTTYMIDRTSISKISNETTVENFMDNITILKESENTIKIFDKNNNQLQSEDIIGTGGRIILDDDMQYKIVVTGDTNGDGHFTLTDMSQMISRLVGVDTLTGVYVKAMDVNYDGKFTITDASIMRQAIVNDTKF